MLASGCWGGAVRLWDLHRCKCTQTFDAQSGVVWSLLHAESRLCSAGGNGLIKLWDPRDATCTGTLGLPRHRNPWAATRSAAAPPLSAPAAAKPKSPPPPQPRAYAQRLLSRAVQGRPRPVPSTAWRSATGCSSRAATTSSCACGTTG